MKGHKWFAAVYDRQMAFAEKRWLAKVREEMVGSLKGRVLEIGAGTGANFPYYHDGVDLIATEPDPYMLEKATRRARETDKSIELKRAPAEELPFEDDSFDVVIGTLVLCSVNKPARALSEIRRVLKPGGEFRSYEHVRYQNPVGAFFQDLIQPAWSWFGAGCHPNRDTLRLIKEAGFEIISAEVKNTFPPVPPMICARPHLKAIVKSPD
jgi:ubiquinone/menaquinone biosynthesis C-methylase UbiE